MAKRKISNRNQTIVVSALTETETDDGNTVKDYIPRFTALADIRPGSVSQAFQNGVDEKDTLFTAYFLYHPDRSINITDKVEWSGKVLYPVGDCLIDDYGDKRQFKQLLKHSAG